MSRLYWAGIALGVEGQEEKIADLLNNRIVEALVRFAPTPISTTTYVDYTEVHYHMLRDGGETVVNIFDRLGTRVGFGILANSEDDAFEQFERAQATLADKLKISHSFEVHVWSWDRDAIPVAKPVLVA